MPTFPSVSLILFAGAGETDQQIWQAVQALGKRQWRTEVLIVDPEPGVETLQRITYRPIPDRFRNVADAIEAAKHPVVAIADPEIEIDPNQWQFMVDRIDALPIQSAFSSPVPRSTQPRRLINALSWFYRLLVRVLLRTGRTELDCGLTIFKKTEIDPWLAEYRQCLVDSDANNEVKPATQANAFAIPQLLALAILHRRSVSETRIGDSRSTGLTNAPGKKQVLNAIQTALRFWWNKVMYPRRQYEMTSRQCSWLEKAAATAVLMLIAAFLLFRSLNFPLFEPDEARNAQLAMNIVDSGQWMSLTLADENYWDKPPLQLWAIAASYRMMGVSQFTTRFPVAIASMLTVLTTLLLGQRLVGFRSAWLGTLLLLLTAGFVCVSRYVTMDASLTAMSTAMLLLGFLAIRGRFKKPYAVMAGVACGIGILIKGPVIGVLCFPPLIALYWISPSPHALPRRWWLWFTVPAFLIAAPWFLATAIIHPDFLIYFFWKHHVIRFSDAFNHREPFWFYFVGIFVFMFPASYLIPSVTKFLTSRKPENRLFRTREHGFLFMSAVWVIVFFSISESKLPTYIVPSFPLICLLMGALMEKTLFRRTASVAVSGSGTLESRQPTWLEKTGRRAPFELLCWCVITSVALLVFFTRESASFSSQDMVIGTLLLSVPAVVWMVYRQKQKIAWTCFALIGLFMVSLTAHRLLPAISATRSVHLAASKLQSTEEFKNSPVVFFGRETYGAGMILDETRIIRFDKSQALSLIEFLNTHPHSIIVSSGEPMESLRRDLTWTIELAECEDARHLYISRPNQAVNAANREISVYR